MLIPAVNGEILKHQFSRECPKWSFEVVAHHSKADTGSHMLKHLFQAPTLKQVEVEEREHVVTVLDSRRGADYVK